MLNDAIIVGMVMVCCTILEYRKSFFRSDEGLLWIKLIVLFAVGVAELINGVVFGSDALSRPVILGYLESGLELGAIASGVYSIGESAIKTTVNRAKKKAGV